MGGGLSLDWGEATHFATINAKRGATFEEARQAYREAAQRAHPDRGGDVETMQRINIAWDRIKQSFGR